MLDPFPIAPPRPLVQAVKPLADTLGLSSLPLHAHEVLFAFALYTTIFFIVSPILSRFLVPQKYNSLNKRTKTNWDVHVVSFFQSVIICVFSLYCIFIDEDRKQWRGADGWENRIWAYSGLSGLCQSFALGYFLWDLWMCTWHVNIFGWGMLAHAISAVSVFALGYRPFLYFYAPVFLLYELSSPFLNIHWFCDKLDLTGSVYQAVNGALLTSTFFGCRICWGLYSSFCVFHDIYTAIQAGHSQPPILLSDATSRNNRSGDISLYYASAEAQRTAFMGTEYIPIWLAATYLASNLTLNLLNIFWFNKMVETIRKRFDPPWGTKGIGPDVVHWEVPEKTTEEKAIVAAQAGYTPGKPKGSVAAAHARADAALETEPLVQRAVYADGHTSVEVTGSTRKSARGRRKV